MRGESEFVDTNQIKAFYHENNLLVILSNKDTLKNLSIKASGTYNIKTSQVNNYYFIAFSKDGSTLYHYFCLIDLLKRKILFEVLDTLKEDYRKVLPNISLSSISPNGQYFLVEGGTAASIRLFKIYNPAGVVLKETNYMTACILKWNAKSELEYCTLKYDELNNKSGKKFTGINNAFGQKYIWTIKGETPVGNLFETYVE